MKVTDFTLREPVVVSCDSTIAQAAETMSTAGVGAVFVTDGDRPVGVVTDRDIVVRCVARGLAADGRVDGLMTMDLVTLGPDATLEDVLAAFDRHAVRRIPIVDNERLVGVASVDDLLVSVSGHLGEIAKVLAAQIMFPHASDEAAAPAVV